MYFSFVFIPLVEIFLITCLPAIRGHEFDFTKRLISSDFLQKFPADKYDLSENCESDISDWIDGLQKEDIWALQMADSIPKFMDGIFMGRLHYPGFFDECVQIRHNNFKGKYCTLQIMMNESNVTQNSQVRFFFGLCMPSTCNSQDINHIVASVNSLNIFEFINITENDCSIDEWRPYRTEDIAVVSFILVLVVIVMASTVYDVWGRYSKEREKSNQLLASFSIYSNFNYVFRISQSATQMKCIYGIRFLSIAWIVLGHCYVTMAMGALINFRDAPGYFTSNYLVLVNNAFVAVDTFFFLSGLLVCIVFFRDVSTKGSFDVPVAFIHRYIRLTPIYAIMILLQATVISRLGNGPFWNRNMDQTEAECRKSWWSSVLYVQNYVKPDALCLGQSWYLSADTQMFWISPIILYPILFLPKFAPALLLFLVFAAAFTNFVIAYLNELKPNLSIALKENFTSQFSVDYIPLHTRLSSWLIGLATGYIICGINANRIRIKLSKVQLLIGWSIGLGLIFASFLTILRFFSFEYTVLESTLYLAFHRVGWSLGLSWIVIACVSGHGGVVNDFLGWDGFQPLAKLSYAIFLIHMSIQLYRINSARINQYLRNYEIVYAFIGDIVIATILAVPATVLFEVPFILIDRYFFRNVKIFPFPKKARARMEIGNRSDQVESGTKNLGNGGEDNAAFKDS